MNDKTNSNDAGFDAKLDQLRQAFADELVKRLGALAEGMAEFDAADAEFDAADIDADRAAALSTLEERAHVLAGSRALFGYPEIGAAAGALEEASGNGVGAPSAPNTESSVRGSWARLRAAADDIKN
ncbi:MAG: hypothetical protein HOA30_14425 [Rhodospirillaceae bacterium]|jgi:HPt (histidine-containing phosphotransfer) domain-containing protein|nr:hypothetical protein [Rhodospirillaceae bacterium]MBT5297359.1 hypothetical protein [Rhodospirillaceae bacterium]MBT5513409.1 hypothetical protein [Rhodospirillaceae bacterium]MBT6885236.1 hypothetical protein [Rhodospirillaceae bacterium]MBT7250354.1 hypothetical protein [Rhodospirillaceae bacterium]